MIEQIFDQALTELRQGHSLDVILARYPGQAADLRPLLEVAQVGYSLPKNIVPTPMRRRKFADQHYRSWWLRSVSILKYGLMPLTLLLVFLGVQTVLEKSNNSLPKNHILYNIKRANEQLQLTLTRNATEQASLQLALTEKRLTEVQQSAGDPAQEALALAALKDQTEKTFPAVAQVAATNAITHRDNTLLNSLAAVNKQQKAVLSALQPQPETKAIADTALTTVTNNTQTLASIIATVHEQTLADLQNKISVSGDATVNPDKTKITINAVSFQITKDTVITGTDGQTIKPADLNSKVTASIVGTQSGTVVTAKIISLIDTGTPALTDDKTGQVKGDVTSKPTEESKPAKKPEAKPTPALTPPAEPETTAPINAPNTATGGAIYESPSSQYAP